uniref:GDSL esterase/lipase n=1 Tax=Oryza sativa subsp. japonica TaxID=39947 RepID=Q2QNJ5_ORYSJ|nr:hypothetical protein LOC_Os12g37620 [Oryza sativa Japonica Group]
MWKELDYFKEYAARLQSFREDEDAAAATLSEALYVVSMGTNDFLENYYAMAHAQAAEYSTAVDLNGLPPMGCLPLERATASGGACTDEKNTVVERFNAGLQDMIARLNDELGDDEMIVYGDVYRPVAAGGVRGGECRQQHRAHAGQPEAAHLCHLLRHVRPRRARRPFLRRARGRKAVLENSHRRPRQGGSGGGGGNMRRRRRQARQATRRGQRQPAVGPWGREWRRPRLDAVRISAVIELPRKRHIKCHVGATSAKTTIKPSRDLICTDFNS